MIRKLPIFRGYTADLRLQKFRKIEANKPSQFIPLLSGSGARLFYEFKQTPTGQKKSDAI